MKKSSLIFTAIMSLLLYVSANAQSKPGADYFSGKWEILVKGTPNGDAKMLVILQKTDTSMSGAIQDSTGTELSKFSKVELKENQVTVYFSTQGYDVYLVMTKKDEDHVNGTMMDMFEANGERIKSTR
ncbi:MAG: hypothetical protein ACHQEM_05555 [Chitinophagales bacterium]